MLGDDNIDTLDSTFHNTTKNNELKETNSSLIIVLSHTITNQPLFEKIKFPA